MLLKEQWKQRIGCQRDWVWRGWQTRYAYKRPSGKVSSHIPPMILLHGFGASIEHWRNNIPVLSENQTVYALDLLGFGASKKVPTQYSVHLWVDQVYDFWQTFIRQPVVLVGNSIGSLVCLVAAATYPDMVAGIAMLSLPDVSLRQETIPKWLQPVVSTLEGAVASPWLITSLFSLLRRPRIIRRWVSLAYTGREAITEELVEILASPARDEGAARTFYALFEAARQPQFSTPAKQILPTLSIPMLLIWGLKDRMVPPSLGPLFANLNPKLKLVELEGVGHCPHDECPALVNAILLGWLAESFPQQQRTNH